MSDDASRGPSEHSLSDEQMRADYRTDPNFLRDVMQEVRDLEFRLEKSDGRQEISVPVASLNRMRMGIRALYKAQTEFGSLGLFGDGNNHGDRGSNCDYNPFGGINFGDL